MPEITVEKYGSRNNWAVREKGALNVAHKPSYLYAKLEVKKEK